MSIKPTLVQRAGSEAETLLAKLRPLEELAPLTAAANGGRAIDFSSLWRYTTTGKRGVKLRSVRVGRKLCSTAEWLLEFFEAVASAPAPAPIQTHARRTREFARRQTAADAVLREAGVLS